MIGTGPGTGDVTAAASFGTDNRVLRSDGTGKGAQASAVTIDDSGNVSGVPNLSMTGYLDLTEMATPSNPAANIARLYCYDDAGTTKVAFRDSAGAETVIGTGPGTGDVTAAASFGTDEIIIMSDGTGKGVQATAYAHTVLKSQTVQVFTASGTWTKPAGLRYAEILVVGGGGGGGGVTGNSANAIGGGGGGAGGHAVSYIAAASLGSTETVTIGAAGSGGAGGSTAGTAGGTTSFGSHLSATGGLNGTSRTASASYPAADPGESGTGTGGNVFNGSGAAATSWFYPLGDPISGNGAASYLGGGGGGRTAPSSPGHANGNTAASFGAGGGGAVVKSGSGTASGGNGKAGIVIVKEHY